MTGLLWAAFGMVVGAAVLHAALGFRRPLDRTYVSFAIILALLAAYLYFEWELYRATELDVAVEIVRLQLMAAHGVLAGILVFVPAYTKMRLPKLVMTAYGVGLAGVFVTNLVSPYGIWFSGAPELERAIFRGEVYSSLIAPPPSLLQHLHTVYVVAIFLFGFICALKQYFRGERQRGATLAIALVVVILHYGVDVVREVIGGAWPYAAEFGLVTWGLIMSVQLAIDFRFDEQRLRATLETAEQGARDLARTVRATLNIRDKLNTPLQTLELGLALRASKSTLDREALDRLHEAIGTLAELGRAVQKAATHSTVDVYAEQP